MLVHVEVQAQSAIGFPERLFAYHCRIRDRFGARCAAFAILADQDRSWRPNEYRDNLLGTELVMRFIRPKAGLRGHRPALEEETTFALVVMAHAACAPPWPIPTPG